MNKLSQKAAARVEELLREQLLEIGVNPASLEPHIVAENMHCEIYPDDSLVYSWQETQLLRVVPEKDKNGAVVNWRMFTKDDTEPTIH